MQEPTSQFPVGVHVGPGARQVIRTANPAVASLLRRYLQLIEGFARRERVAVLKTRVGAYHDPDEDSDQLLVSQRVKLPEEAAMDYWDRLGTEVENWVGQLDPEAAELVSEWIALEVRPGAADEAA